MTSNAQNSPVSTTTTTSNYDALGLLAICYAIEAVEEEESKSHQKSSYLVPRRRKTSSTSGGSILSSANGRKLSLPSTFNHFRNSLIAEHNNAHSTTGANSSLGSASSVLPVLAQSYSVTKPDSHHHRRKKSEAQLPPLILESGLEKKRATSVSSAVGAGVAVASVAASPSGATQPLVINGFKVEECHICGRCFKGPKASTHKQQHIRRLHPDDYIPKRGGKKRVVIEPLATPQPIAPAAAAAAAATTTTPVGAQIPVPGHISEGVPLVPPGSHLGEPGTPPALPTPGFYAAPSAVNSAAGIMPQQ
ncbi:hypothetical protein D0Z03_000116 [Geotrichum reessii]|nr:hypothetical protein D0Z03_000116 [Galactomyces reessii]